MFSGILLQHNARQKKCGFKQGICELVLVSVCVCVRTHVCECVHVRVSVCLAVN